MKVRRLAFLGLLVALIATCCSMCFFTFVGDAARRHLRYWAAKPVYKEKLGISNSDDKLEVFMTKELKGLTRQEVVEKLVLYQSESDMLKVPSQPAGRQDCLS